MPQVEPSLIDTQPLKIQIVKSLKGEEFTPCIYDSNNEDQTNVSNVPMPSFLNGRRSLDSNLDLKVDFKPLHMVSGQKMVKSNTRKQPAIFAQYRCCESNINSQARKIIQNYNNHGSRVYT